MQYAINRSAKDSIIDLNSEANVVVNLIDFVILLS